MNIQYLVDGVLAEAAKERAKSQMTLGGLIDTLKELNPNMEVMGLEEPHSYRGYYQDLAFELSVSNMKVSEMLNMCQECMGEVFEGYKGGDFQMGRNTPIWVANYGSCGDKIVHLGPEGIFEIEADSWD